MEQDRHHDTEGKIACAIISLQQDIRFVYGNYRPCITPLECAVLVNSNNPFQYGSKKWLDIFQSSALICIFDKLTTIVNGKENGEKASKCIRCVHALRLFNYFMGTTIFSEIDKFYTSSILFQCSFLLVNALRDMCFHHNNNTLLMEKRLTGIVNETHSKHNRLPSIYRFRYFNSFYTKCKKEINKAINDFITERWQNTIKLVNKPIVPSVDYSRRVAVHKLILHKIH